MNQSNYESRLIIKMYTYIFSLNISLKIVNIWVLSITYFLIIDHRYLSVHQKYILSSDHDS